MARHTICLAFAALTVAVVASATNGASTTRVSAFVTGPPRVNIVFLGTLTARTLSWRLVLRGTTSPSVTLRFGRPRAGAPALVLCSACRPAARGRLTLSERFAVLLRGGSAFLDVGANGKTLRGEVATGAPTLEIVSPEAGATIQLPAQVVYRISNFDVGRPPLGRVEAFAAGSDARVALELGERAGTAELPDVKAAFLPGRRDVTFALATADGTLLPNPEARVTVHDLTIEGRR